MQSVKIYKTDEIDQSVLDTIKNDYENTSYEDDYHSIYQMQIIFSKQGNPDSYFVAAFVDDVYLGGTLLFLKGSRSIDDVDQDGNYITLEVPCPIIEATAKSQKGLSSEVKLNSLIIPAIKEFLLLNGYHSVYVIPVPRQGDILLNHYGFCTYHAEDSGALILQL